LCHRVEKSCKECEEESERTAEEKTVLTTWGSRNSRKRYEQSHGWACWRNGQRKIGLLDSSDGGKSYCNSETIKEAASRGHASLAHQGGDPAVPKGQKTGGTQEACISMGKQVLKGGKRPKRSGGGRQRDKRREEDPMLWARTLT